MFTIVSKVVRYLGEIFCWGIYEFLGFIYQIFFNVAEADLLSSATILDFYKRVQLIIGVYMVFQLALIIMRGIFNVEEVSDKNNGQFIKKVIIALTMLAVLTPISIPNASNDYERRINNNGLLFGILYDLQYRLLDQNTLGKLVLGTDNNSFSVEDDSGRESAANEFTTSVLRGFISINLKDDAKESETDENLELNSSNWACQIDQDTLDKYRKADSTPHEILSVVTEDCSTDLIGLIGHEFAFDFHWFFALIAGVFFIIIMGSFCIDVVVRAIKLAFLRLIAPIPIIGYMDPKGSKDTGFDSWVKTLTKTYLDLFIRLIIIYFIMFLIHTFITDGIYINRVNGVIGAISYVLIFVGLFVFAKEAPKFIQQAIGLKEEPGGNFIGKAFGRSAAALGAIGSFNASRIASRNSDVANGKAYFDEKGKVKYNSQMGGVFNRGKSLVAGMVGGVSGFGTGLSAAETAKDHNLKAALDAQQKRNAMDISRGGSGSTFVGRAATNAQRIFRGRDAYEADTATIATQKSQAAAAKDLVSYLESKGQTDFADNRVTTEFKWVDENGQDQKANIKMSHNELSKAIADANPMNKGDGVIKLKTAEGGTQTFDYNDGRIDKIKKQVDYEAGREWAVKEYAKTNADDRDQGLVQKVDVMEYNDPTAFNINKQDSVNSLFKYYKKTEGKANTTETGRAYNRHKGDHGATGGNK